jgi:hypothetical protein
MLNLLFLYIYFSGILLPFFLLTFHYFKIHYLRINKVTLINSHETELKFRTQNEPLIKVHSPYS